MSSPEAPTPPAVKTFTTSELAFALAFADHAPFLGGCVVEIRATDEGDEYARVRPLFALGGGYHITQSDIAGVEITWGVDFRQRAVAFDLRAALQRICPLSPELVTIIEVQAAAWLAKAVARLPAP